MVTNESSKQTKRAGTDSDAGYALENDSSGQERRRYRRIPAELTMKVTVPGERGSEPERIETTTTVNVSPGDAFFVSSLHKRLEIGSELMLAIELPVGPTNLFTGKRLQVKGLVVRLGTLDAGDPNKRGVAVRFLKTPRFINDLE